jgi:hypothetical protein
MKRYLLIAWIAVVCFVCSGYCLASDLQKAFNRPYEQLLQEVAAQSPIFHDSAEVENALLTKGAQDSVARLKKKIAAVRMLMADGQINPADKVSSPFLTLSARMLVAAGEQWISIAQAEKSAESDQGAVKTEEKTAEEIKAEECRKKDNLFDIGDCDEFNFFDIIAFPFRLIFAILELLFNIILFPFKLLAELFV